MTRTQNFDGNDLDDDLETTDAVELSKPQFPALTFDLERHRALVAGEGWSPAQEEAYLTALWSIMVGFVDLGFRILPVQQLPIPQKSLGDESASMIDSGDISDSFNHCTATRVPIFPGTAPQKRTDS